MFANFWLVEMSLLRKIKLTLLKPGSITNQYLRKRIPKKSRKAKKL